MKTQVLQLLLCKYDVPFATGDTAMDLPVCKITAEGQENQVWLPSVREQPSIIRIPFMVSR